MMRAQRVSLLLGMALAGLVIGAYQMYDLRRRLETTEQALQDMAQEQAKLRAAHKAVVVQDTVSSGLMLKLGTRTQRLEHLLQKVVRDESDVDASVANIEKAMESGGIAIDRQEIMTLQRQITFVLTLTNDPEDMKRAALLVASLCKFWRYREIAAMLVIVPNFARKDLLAEIAEWKSSRVCAAKFPIQLVAQSAVLPTDFKILQQRTPKGERIDGGGRGTGYRASMLIKLAASKVVKTPFYITVDADTFAVRPTSYSEIVRGGKALLQGNAHQHRASWFEAASKILTAKQACRPRGMPGVFNSVDPDEPPAENPLNTPIIGVTPAILNTEVARSLLKRIDGLGEKLSKSMQAKGAVFAPMRWDELLFAWSKKHDWSEYALYWTHACDTGMLGKVHALPGTGAFKVPRAGLRMYDDSFFEYDSFEEFSGPDVFLGREGRILFLVVQSIGGSDPAAVSNTLNPWFMSDENKRRPNARSLDIGERVRAAMGGKGAPGD